MDENKVEENKIPEKGNEKNTAMAVVAYFLFFVPLLTDDKNDPFVKFHVKQSLLLVLGMLACSVVALIPIIGWIIALIGPMVIFVLWIMGLINAINGNMKEVPLVGKYAEEWLKF